MPASVVTIAQQKGGAGKTTLAIHLAVAWSAGGRRVAVIDIDPQASLTRWHKLRLEKLGEAGAIPHVVTLTGWRTANEVSRLGRDYDLLVLDSPPHAETDARIAVRAAGIVLVPIQPNVMDLWATGATLDLAKAEKVPAMLVLNRVPPRSRAAEEVAAEAAKLGVPVAASRIGNRVVLAASLLEGRGVTESDGSSVAAAEIRALADEVLRKV